MSWSKFVYQLNLVVSLTSETIEIRFRMKGLATFSADFELNGRLIAPVNCHPSPHSR